MNKLSRMGYRLALAFTIAMGLLAAVGGLAAAITDSGRLLAGALLLVGLGVAGLAVSSHFQMRESLRVLRAAISSAAQMAPPVAAARVDQQRLIDAVEELRRTAQLNQNNELYLLDAITSLEERIGRPGHPGE